MKSDFPILLSGLLFLSVACGRTQPPEEEPVSFAHLDSPEKVVRQYQAFLDSNLFVQAKLLSTPREAERLDALVSLFDGEPLDSTVLHTAFLNINCVERSDSAFCACKLQDEYETYDARFTLIRLNGRWLVDPPDEEAEESLEFSEEWLEGEFDPAGEEVPKDKRQ